MPFIIFYGLDKNYFKNQYLQMLKIIFQGDRKTDNLYNN